MRHTSAVVHTIEAPVPNAPLKVQDGAPHVPRRNQPHAYPHRCVLPPPVRGSPVQVGLPCPSRS